MERVAKGCQGSSGRPSRYNQVIVRLPIPPSSSDRSHARRDPHAPPELDDVGPATYWDGILGDFSESPDVDPWRAYMRRIYARLLTEWMSLPSASAPALKTDLFEEAISCHHVLGDLGPGSVGIDCSPAIVSAARRRMGPGYRLVVADLRDLPLQTGAVGQILAGSSLDHFSDKSDIAVALGELVRVLEPGGILVVTFDNPQNPIVWLRNWLPFAWLHRLRLVPYYVGATCSHVEAARILTELGLEVTATGAVVHAPRMPAIWLAALAGWLGRPRLCRLVDWLLDRFEALGRLPTRYRTGYYVAVRATKVKD